MQNVIKQSPVSTGWGGARKGAGRKAKPKGKNYTFRSTPETEAILNDLKESKSDYINRAIMSYFKSQGF